MKRNLAIAILPLALSGCLPLPITVASTAFSSISYLTSGKSTTDHVLSATMEQDCALTRPVFGDPVCRDVGPHGEGRTPAMIVASYPGDRDDGFSNEERLANRMRGALNVAEVNEDAKQVAIAPRYLSAPPRVSVAGVIVTKDQLVPDARTRTLPVATDVSWAALVPAKTIEVAPLAPPVPSITKAPQPVSSQPVSPQPAASKTATPKPSAQLAAVPPKPAVRSKTDADRWVVIGSFRDVERAKVMAGRFADREPAILAANVEGGQWHRVAIGPLTPSAAKGVRDGLGRVDGRMPWVVRIAD